MSQITIHQTAEKQGITLSQQHLSQAGMQAASLYEQLTGAKPKKAMQMEKCADNSFRRFAVNVYPEEFEPVIMNLIDSVKK